MDEGKIIRYLKIGWKPVRESSGSFLNFELLGEIKI